MDRVAIASAILERMLELSEKNWAFARWYHLDKRGKRDGVEHDSPLALAKSLLDDDRMIDFYSNDSGGGIPIEIADLFEGKQGWEIEVA